MIHSLQLFEIKIKQFFYQIYFLILQWLVFIVGGQYFFCYSKNIAHKLACLNGRLTSIYPKPSGLFQLIKVIFLIAQRSHIFYEVDALG